MAFNIRGRFVYFHQDHNKDSTPSASGYPSFHVTFDHAKPLVINTDDHSRELEFKKHILHLNRINKGSGYTRRWIGSAIASMATSMIRDQWRLCFIVDAIEIVERDKLPVIITTKQNTDISPQIPEFARMRKWTTGKTEGQLTGWRKTEEATILEFRTLDGETRLVDWKLLKESLTPLERKMLREQTQIE